MTMKTQEELAAEQAAADAAATEAATLAAAEAAAREQAEAEAAAAAQANADDAITARVAAETTRVAGIFGATPKGFEAVRDQAIQSGSSVAMFQALVEASTKAARAEGIASDTEANAEVPPSTTRTQATGDDAAVAAILAAGKKARG